MGCRAVVSVLSLALALACSPEPTQLGPFKAVEEAAWRTVNRSQEGADGIFVQAELRTMAYEIASAYAQAEQEKLSQEQLEYRLRQLIYSYVDGTYPVSDGTDINNLFYQYLVWVNPRFDRANPIDRQVFNTWRAEFVDRLIRLIYDPKLPVLRNTYDARWGVTLYSRLVFIVYLKNQNHQPALPIGDVGAHTFLVDEQGQRYAPSGNYGPYLYETDRPTHDMLQDEAVYRVVYPNRKADHRTPIITERSTRVTLEIDGLGAVPTRRLQWSLPLTYPRLPQRRLASEDTQVPAAAPAP